MLPVSQTNTSFNRQLSSVFLIGVLILAIISSVTISWIVSQAARNYVVDNWLETTSSFALQSKLALLYQSEENASLPVKTMLAYPNVKQVAIFYPDYKALTIAGESDSSGVDLNQVSRSRNAQLVQETDNAWYFASPVFSSSLTEVVDSPFEEIQPDVSLLGIVLVTVGKETLNAMIQRTFLINLVIAVALASFLLLILLIITKRMTTPLERLSKIMQRAEEGETEIRAELGSAPKEIVNMELAFNKMMTVLEERECELKDARDAALETARIKAEFAAVVSHEIRTPLNGVLGMLNLLNEVGVPPRQREYLNVAISSGDALIQLINDILDFSKLEAGKLELETIDFDLRECIEDVAALFVEKAQMKDIGLCINIPVDLPKIVKGDVIRLRQILNNLLSNAFKFTEQGDVILLLKWRQEKDIGIWVDFVVVDSGVGIPLAVQQKIFESFSQADSSTTRKFGGTGLGLAICKQLIDILGGVMDVSSTPGQGSQFSFSLPMELVTPYSAEPCFDKERILVVHANEASRVYLVATLELFGLSCDAVGTQDEALKKLISGPQQLPTYRVCIFNPNICESNIHSFIRKVRASMWNSELRIVLLASPRVINDDSYHIDVSISAPARYAVLKETMKELLHRVTIPEAIKDRRVQVDEGGMASIRVLVVDDNRTNQLVAKAMLAESGYAAEVASNGEEALKFVTQKHYDLVLMDCSMPVMDGYEATKRIRLLDGHAGKTPVYAMTAIDNPRDIQRCYEVGMNDLLIKPLNLEVLRQKLNQQFRAKSSTLSTNSQTEIQASIDYNSITNLENAVGSTVSEIIEAFLADTPAYIKQLNNELENEDWDKVVSVVHSLKGSARNLGANLFSSICREIEDLCRNEKMSELAGMHLFNDLKEEYIRVEKSLSVKLSDLIKSKPVKPAGEREMILIVDDDRSTRLTIANALKPDGVMIQYAVNGQEAVAKYKQLKPNLVIMDVVMPVMNGFNAIEEIKRLPGGRITPILMVTAKENDEAVERAFKSGAADFIPKPINLAVLRQRVKRVLAAHQSEKRVQQLAYSDSLTGLPNRIAFSDRLQQDLAYAKRNDNQLAVLFVDIDHFKDVNDNLGHAAGDELLKILAGRVAGCIRGEDTLARLGGDEFVVVLSAVHGPKGADIAANNILVALSTPFQIFGKEIYVGASIGISIYPEDGSDRETLIKNADTAMYRAKALGRNNYQFYTLEMSSSIAERIELETDLRKVIINNELLAYYQPKIATQTGTVIGAEALVRWQHPVRGLLSPDSFIPIAEEVGLIDDIGMWIMRCACAQLKTWQTERGYFGNIAVNVSARQFIDPEFIESVKKCLEMTELAPEYLELEITENLILEHGDETMEKIKKLGNMGVQIAIDDFGVGYSSFSYLKRMPINVLKMDRSFVRDIPEDQSSAAIIDGMILLAHNLNMKVVAEGVESNAQFQFLQEHDCDAVQGFLFGQPVPSTEFCEKHIITETRVI